VIPELKGKLNGHAIRVPLATSSLTDITLEMAREVTVEEIHGAHATRTAHAPTTPGAFTACAGSSPSTHPSRTPAPGPCLAYRRARPLPPAPLPARAQACCTRLPRAR
jgi:aspartate-semialdehyde dehydrogenase